MGKEKQVSFSAVRLFLYKLLSIHLIEKPSDSGVMKQIKQVVKSDLEDRYSDPHLMMLLNKVCFLDPHFKSLSFLSDEDRKSVLLSVEEEAAHIKTEMISSKGENPADGSEPSKKKAKQESKFLLLLKDVLDKLDTTHADISPQEVANKEIQKHLCIDANRKENSTRWWKIYCTQLPLLATMAQKYLCIPATSAPSECAFSTARNIVNAKHFCLLPEIHKHFNIFSTKSGLVLFSYVFLSMHCTCTRLKVLYSNIYMFGNYRDYHNKILNYHDITFSIITQH